MPSDPVWTLERSFWLEGASFYDAHLHAGAVMIFPHMGILDRISIIESLAAASRWTEVEMEERHSAAADHTIVLTYLAVARRDTDPPYRAFCSSTYVRTGDDWMMLAHQQTPQD